MKIAGICTRVIFVGLVCSVFNFGAYADNTLNLTSAIQNARTACSGISDSMSSLKTRAGINTALTGAGTVAGGVALGTGIAKSGVDKQYVHVDSIKGDKGALEKMNLNPQAVTGYLVGLMKKSKTLGNIRTGTMAGAAVLDTAGTIMAATNKVGEDLTKNVNNCISAVEKLKTEQSRARAENTASNAEISTAEKIVSGCSDWKYVDLSKIDKRATGAAVTGGIGAAMAVVGTITSVAANKKAIEESKGLNTTSNVLAGGTTVASATSTIFNATQISAIKKAVSAADKCEEALR